MAKTSSKTEKAPEKKSDEQVKKQPKKQSKKKTDVESGAVTTGVTNVVELVKSDSPEVVKETKVSKKPKEPKAQKKTKAQKDVVETVSDSTPSAVKSVVLPNPVLSKPAGINISPAKVKNVVSNFVLNKEAYSALSELKNARPYTNISVVDGKEVSEEVKGTPVAQLSKRTLDYIALAVSEYETLQRDEYAKLKVSKMTEANRKLYNKARSDAKELFDSKNDELFLDSNYPTFNVEQFNKQFDAAFYSDYDKTKAASDLADKTDEWKKAIDKVTKLKNRFSTNSRVLLSAFVEYVVKQMALNGVVSCVSDKKKIIQLSHVLDTTKDGFADRFPLYPLLLNLDTFRQAQAYLKNPSQKVDDTEVEYDTDDSKVKTSDSDLFSLNGVSLDTQYQFRYYVAETCRETRVELAATVDSMGNAMTVYSHTSVSKVFKNFCSTLVCELLLKFGRMLKKEIETRGIKTVNDTIIGTVLSHFHTVCGVDEDETFTFVREATTKYYSFVSDRQTKRKNSKDSKTPVV